MRTSLLALALALPVVAQEAPTPKLAFFVPDQVIGMSVRGKQLFAELEALQKQLFEKVQAKGQELQKLDQQMKSPGISDEGRARLQSELQKGETEYKRLQEDSNAEYNRVRERIGGQFNQEIRPLIDELQKEWKLQAVFNFSPNMLVAADEQWLFSFSNELAKRYDAKYSAGASAPAKPAPKPAAKK